MLKQEGTYTFCIRDARYPICGWPTPLHCWYSTNNSAVLTASGTVVSTCEQSNTGTGTYILRVLRVPPVNYNSTNGQYPFTYQAGDGQRVHKVHRSTGSLTPTTTELREQQRAASSYLALSYPKGIGFDCESEKAAKSNV